MAFVDNTLGGRIVEALAPRFRITLAGTVKPGDLIGYSTGWKAADSDAPIPARMIAMAGGDSGDVISATTMALVDFGSGSTATANDAIYLSTTAGRYTATGPVVTGGQQVGTMIDATKAIVTTIRPNTLVSDSLSQPIGYGVGAGGAVTQITNRSTGVTLSTLAGTITGDGTSLAAEATATFTVTNTRVAANDVVVIAVKSGPTSGATSFRVTAVAAGSFDISATNNNASGGTADTGAPVINFVVLKSAIT